MINKTQRTRLGAYEKLEGESTDMQSAMQPIPFCDVQMSEISEISEISKYNELSVTFIIDKNSFHQPLIKEKRNMMAAHAPKYFQVLMDNITLFLNQVIANLETMTFERSIKYVKVISTDSDYHIGAMQVICLECYRNYDDIGNHNIFKKIYYKPHNMHAENIMFGAQSLFTKLGLQTTNIEECDGYGLMEGVIKEKDKEIIPEALQDQFCIEIGKIIIASELFGIGDLHSDNIVSSQNRPTILDGEFVFNPNIINGKEANCLIIPRFFNLGGLVALFVHLGVQDIKAVPGKFKIPLLTGIHEVCTRLETDDDFIIKYKSVDNVRITFRATHDLKGDLDMFWFLYRFHEKEENVLEATYNDMREKKTLAKVPPIHEEICQNIVSEGFLEPNNINEEFKKRLITLLLKSFANGDLPYFTFSPKTGEVMIDNNYFFQSLYQLEVIEDIYNQKKAIWQNKNDNEILVYLQEKYGVFFLNDD